MTDPHATQDRAATRDLTDWLDGMDIGVDRAARVAAGLMMQLQPEHWSEFDRGWNAALTMFIRELQKPENPDA